jgi:hypothetical protein
MFILSGGHWVKDSDTQNCNIKYIACYFASIISPSPIHMYTCVPSGGYLPLSPFYMRVYEAQLS